VRLRTILALAVAAALAAPSTALAHAKLVRSDPPTGAVLAAPPTAVRLFFDDVVRLQGGMRAVRNGHGSILAGRPHLVSGRQLIIPLRARLPRGDYTILWRALSDDGHSIGGITTFAVGAGRPPPRAAFGAPSEERPFAVFARWLFFSGILAACGTALFRFAMPPEAAPPLRLLFVSFLFVVAGGVILVEQASLDTRFGLAVGAAVVVAAAGLAITAVAARYRRLSAGPWLSGLLLLPTPSVAGHALDAGRPRLELPVDLLHIAASSLWLGGLLSLALAIRRGAAGERLVRRFSALALGSVLVLGATGVIRALAELGAVSQIWSTNYGRLLIAKTAILGLLASIGWTNRYRIIPAFARSASALLRNVAAELLLFVGLIAAVALLTQSRPGRDLANPATAAVRAPAESGTPSSGAVVLGERRSTIEIEGRVPSAVALGRRYVVWETLGTEEGEAPALVQRDLRSRRTRILARAIAAQYPLASTGTWVVYAAATVPPRLIAVTRDGRRRLVLTSRLLAPFAARGGVVAWAEQGGGDRQRVVARNMATGKESVVADLPSCDRGRCYRIDAVTLADEGVAFDRGAIGPQPSFVVRRAFRAARNDVISIANDPQPDLVPSSAGVVYYAFGRGWYRWDFGQTQPRRASLFASTQPVGYENGTWLLLDHRTCGDTLLAELRSGRRIVIATPAKIRALVGVANDLCATFSSLSWIGNRPLTTWLIAPADSHSEEGVTSVIFVGPAL
jgi:copper transport protein